MQDRNPLVRMFFNVLLGAYAFALIVFDNAVYLGLVQVFGAVLSGSFLVYALLTKTRLRFPPPLIAYAALVALGAASVFWSLAPDLSLARTKTMALIAVNLFVVYNVIVLFRNAISFFAGLYAAAIVNLLIALGVLNLGFELDAARFGGTLAQANLFGYFTATTLFFAYLHILSVPQRKAVAATRLAEIALLFLLGAVLVFLTFISGSRTALAVLALILSWILVSSLVRPILALPLAVVGAGLFVASTAVNIGTLTLDSDFSVAEVSEVVLNRVESGAEDADGSRDAREELARAAYAQFVARPLTGMGLAAFEAEFETYSHNNYLEVASSFGLPGLVLLGAMYLLFLREVLTLRSIRLRIFFGLFYGGLFVFDIALVTFAHKMLLLMPFVALACIRVLRESPSESLLAIDDGAVRVTRRRRRRRRRIPVSAQG